MKLMKNGWLEMRRGIAMWALAATLMAMAQAVTTTTVQGTVYLANGQPGAGTLVVSWPAFTTATGRRWRQTDDGDNWGGWICEREPCAECGRDAGGTVLHGRVPHERWNDEHAVLGGSGGGTGDAGAGAGAGDARGAGGAGGEQGVRGPGNNGADHYKPADGFGRDAEGTAVFECGPDAALAGGDKHYVDTQVGTAVPLAGGNMTGRLGTPAVNGVEAPAVGSAQTTLQAAMNAAGTNGAMEIPPKYAGTDTFTNPNGVQVTDLRTTGAQQTERSVKEFGAVCDGVTDDTNALQAALNYANTHDVALTIPEGTARRGR